MKPFRDRPAATSARSRTAFLAAIGSQHPREIRLGAHPIIVGADPRCDVVLDDPTVSRRHASLQRRQRVVLLTDLGSTNGTFVNGRHLVGSVALSPGDEVHFGALAFRFHGPELPHPGARRRVWRRIAIAVACVLAATALAASVYYFRFHELPAVPGLQRFSEAIWHAHAHTPAHAPGAAPAPARAEVGVAQSSGWLARLNHYRTLAKLAPVRDDPALSHGDAAHARYLVANEAPAIRSGNIGASMHSEEPGKPFFTRAGLEAARLSDVDADYSSPPVAPPPGWAIENWITGPFHRMWLLNPALARVGYGQFCEDGICAAALNVQSGVDHMDRAAAARPVMFPPDGATVANGIFGADEGEWPDPLAPCPGYETPTGIPITMQLGINLPALLDRYSLEKDGVPVKACGYDAGSYRNPDAVALSLARGGLRHFGAIVIVPRQPLVAGATYQVRATVSGERYVWSFTVARREIQP